MNSATSQLPALIPLARLLGQRRVSTTADTTRVEFDVTQDWTQGRTVFGGMISAFGVQAMRDLPALAGHRETSLRALQTSFIGPISEGRVSVEAVLLRDGKSVKQAQATLRQNGQVAAIMLAVYANDRESTMRPVALARPAAAHEPETLARRDFDVSTSPAFIRHFDIRRDTGSTPESGADNKLSTRIHMRMVDGEGLNDEITTVLMADTSPTPATGQFSTRPPASSISWALELRPLRQSPPADGWWRIDNDSLVVAGGYVNDSARLWAPSGELAALAYQVIAVYG